MTLVATLDSFYKRYAYRLGLMACVLLPLKLSIAYIFLVSELLLWLVHIRFKIWSSLRSGGSVIIPYVFFILVAFFALFFGFDPLRSLDKLSGVVFFGLTILAFRDLCLSNPSYCEKLLLGLVGGQSIAALHSVLEGSLGIPKMFIGAVSESGQLAFSIPIACGLILFKSRSLLDNSGPGETRRKLDCLLGIVNFCFLTVLAFSPASQSTSIIFWTTLGSTTLLFFFSIARLRKDFRAAQVAPECSGSFLKTIALPLLLAALLVNLKRGPWMGVCVGGLLLLWLERRRLTLPIVVIAAILLVTVRPIQERLAKSEEHFFIVGGRSEIWDIGVDLAKRFPLGVGYRNSMYLQKFSANVPHDLTHFHNNLLNILVEVGWLGLAVFLWWIFSIMRAAFRKTSSKRHRILQRTIGCGILSWQTAGLVEYNFGDSEVVLVALIITGMLAALISESETKRT